MGHYKDFPVQKQFLSKYVFAQNELVWSCVAFCLFFFTFVLHMKQRYTTKKPIGMNRYSYIFLAITFCAYLFGFCYGLLGNFLDITNKKEFNKIQKARQMLSGISSALFEMGWASLVLLAKNIHRMLCLKSKKAVHGWVYLNILQLSIVLIVTIVQTEYIHPNYGVLIFLTRIVNWCFGVINAIVYIIMYLRLRRFVVNSHELSLEVYNSSSAACRHFGWFICSYFLHVSLDTFLTVATIADTAGWFSKTFLPVVAVQMCYAPSRFYTFACAFIFFRPIWTIYIDFANPQLKCNGASPRESSRNGATDLQRSISSVGGPLLSTNSVFNIIETLENGPTENRFKKKLSEGFALDVIHQSPPTSQA